MICLKDADSGLDALTQRKYAKAEYQSFMTVVEGKFDASFTMRRKNKIRNLIRSAEGRWDGWQKYCWKLRI